MRIVNRTCYDTDDIVRIWNEIRKACETDRGARRYYPRSLAPEPTAMEICYYSPREKPERYWRFTTDTRRRPDKPARLAIIKPELLPLTPLEHLAAAADEELVLPPEIVRSIASGLTEAVYYFPKHIARNEWSWVDAYKIRYQPEKQVVTPAIKREIAELRIAELQDKLHREETKQRDLTRSMEIISKKVSKTKDQIAKMIRRLGAS